MCVCVCVSLTPHSKQTLRKFNDMQNRIIPALPGLSIDIIHGPNVHYLNSPIPASLPMTRTTATYGTSRCRRKFPRTTNKSQTSHPQLFQCSFFFPFHFVKTETEIQSVQQFSKFDDRVTGSCFELRLLKQGQKITCVFLV